MIQESLNNILKVLPYHKKFRELTIGQILNFTSKNRDEYENSIDLRYFDLSNKYSILTDPEVKDSDSDEKKNPLSESGQQ